MNLPELLLTVAAAREVGGRPTMTIEVFFAFICP